MENRVSMVTTTEHTRLKFNHLTAPDLLLLHKRSTVLWTGEIVLPHMVSLFCFNQLHSIPANDVMPTYLVSKRIEQLVNGVFPAALEKSSVSPQIACDNCVLNSEQLKHPDPISTVLKAISEILFWVVTNLGCQEWGWLCNCKTNHVMCSNSGVHLLCNPQLHI